MTGLCCKKKIVWNVLKDNQFKSNSKVLCYKYLRLDRTSRINNGDYDDNAMITEISKGWRTIIMWTVSKTKGSFLD